MHKNTILEPTKLIPFLIKLFALAIGALVALALSGDIELDKQEHARLKINLFIVIKISCAIGTGLFLGEFIVDWWDLDHLNYYAQALFFLIASAFGMLILGIIYRSIQLTFTDKTLHEIISELKRIIRAFIR